MLIPLLLITPVTIFRLLPNFLTDWAIHVTNEAIWQCNGLELDAMYPLVAIIHHSLSFTGFKNRCYSAVYESEAVV